MTKTTTTTGLTVRTGETYTTAANGSLDAVTIKVTGFGPDNNTLTRWLGSWMSIAKNGDDFRVYGELSGGMSGAGWILASELIGDVDGDVDRPYTDAEISDVFDSVRATTTTSSFIAPVVEVEADASDACIRRMEKQLATAERDAMETPLGHVASALVKLGTDESVADVLNLFLSCDDDDQLTDDEADHGIRFFEAIFGHASQLTIAIAQGRDDDADQLREAQLAASRDWALNELRQNEIRRSDGSQLSQEMITAHNIVD